MNTANAMAPAKSIPDAWVSLLELAAREVFEIMLGCKLEVPPEPPAASGDITAMVGLAGQLCGLLTLRCTTQSAALMVSKMLGTEIHSGDGQMWDALGEIANMVAGNFKNKLTGMGDKCMLSVPTVITGSDYNYRSMADTGPLELTFLFESLPVVVALEVHS
jgi:chemotaxis protein CheX